MEGSLNLRNLPDRENFTSGLDLVLRQYELRSVNFESNVQGVIGHNSSLVIVIGKEENLMFAINITIY